MGTWEFIQLYCNSFGGNFSHLVGFQDDEDALDNKPNIVQKWWRKLRKWQDFNAIPQENEPSFYRATGGGSPEEQFVVKDRMTAYTSAQRSSMVMQILQRARCDDTAKVSGHISSQYMKFLVV